jgi:hypothetical protein
MNTFNENTTKKDKIIIALLIIYSIFVVSANVAINFFS